MCDQGAKADLVVAETAARQHGVVSVRDLRAAGLDKHRVRHRVQTGRLHRLYRGVYAVGHVAPSLQRDWMAAVIACRREVSWYRENAHDASSVDEAADDPMTALAAGELETIFGRWGAALGYRSAAELWELLPVRDGPIDVSIPGDGGKKRRRGIRLHRSSSLLPSAVTLRRSIPVTTPARTISDLRGAVSSSGKAGLVSERELRRAIRQANVLGLPIGDEVPRDRTRSDLERDFLRLCRNHGLPVPEVNVRIGPHLIDFLWRNRMLVVETDGYQYHRGRVAFEDDRARDLDLKERGFEVIRLAEKQLDDEQRRVAEVIRAALRVGAGGDESES